MTIEFEVSGVGLESRCVCVWWGVGGGRGGKVAGVGDAHGFHTGQHVVEGLVMLLLLLLLLLLLPGKLGAQSLVVLHYFLDQLHRDEGGRRIHTLTHAHTNTRARTHTHTPAS